MPTVGAAVAGGSSASQMSLQCRRVRARHAQAEKDRRQQVKAASQSVESTEVKPARGHAAEPFFHLRSATGQAAMKLVRLAPQPGSLLLPGMPSGGSQRQGP